MPWPCEVFRRRPPDPVTPVPQSETDPTRILRIIARMTGGPAYHVALLSGRLDRARYETALLHGRTAPGEPSLDHLAREEECSTHVIEALGPALRPMADVRAFLALIRMLRNYQPDILHTHTAKAGALGRLAVAFARRPRPRVVHTYHGHVLEGYFSTPVAVMYRLVERLLARTSDQLIGVSRATVNDLLRLRVAPEGKFSVIPVGLELERFAHADREAGSWLRSELGIASSELLLAYVGRLAPIKRVDVLLRAMQEITRAGSSTSHLVIAGDGECRADLERLSADLKLEGRVTFLGNVRDTVPLNAAADIAVLSSDNEGTPVALIEASAAGRPSVATDVGGVPDVVLDSTGIRVPRGDEHSFAAGVLKLAHDPALRAKLGAAAHSHVMERFSCSRLLEDIDALYQELTPTAAARRTRSSASRSPAASAAASTPSETSRGDSRTTRADA